MSTSTRIAEIDAADNDESDSPQAARRRLFSVACELFLLVSCFVFAIYSTRMDPRRRSQPASTTPAQQTKSPARIAPPSSAPPTHPAGKSLAHVG